MFKNSCVLRGKYFHTHIYTNQRKRKERYLPEIRNEIPAGIPIVPKLNHEISPSCETRVAASRDSRFIRPFFLPLLISKYSKFARTGMEGDLDRGETTPSRTPAKKWNEKVREEGKVVLEARETRHFILDRGTEYTRRKSVRKSTRGSICSTLRLIGNL